ncbi:hypothetical protein DFR41_1251, partial [Pseudacidovorax intermedius]
MLGQIIEIHHSSLPFAEPIRLMHRSARHIAVPQSTETRISTSPDAPPGSEPVKLQLTAPVPPVACTVAQPTGAAGAAFAGVTFVHVPSCTGVVPACALTKLVY